MAVKPIKVTVSTDRFGLILVEVRVDDRHFSLSAGTLENALEELRQQVQEHYDDLHERVLLGIGPVIQVETYGLDEEGNPDRALLQELDRQHVARMRAQDMRWRENRARLARWAYDAQPV